MKTKQCSFCNKEVPKLWYANPKCCADYKCRAEYAKVKGKEKTSPVKGNALSSKGRVSKNSSSGEMEVFKQIWNERPRVCFCCGVTLGTKLKPIFFSHVLAKGSYGRFKFYKGNILLKCPTCHHEWEFSDRKNVKFNAVKTKYEELRTLYYKLYYRT